MQTVKALILSMTKRQEYLPWSIKFRLENGQVFTTTVGTPGGITVAGSLFEKFITDSEPKMKQYPFVYNLLIHPADKRVIDVRFIAEKPAIMDMRQATVTYLLGQLAPSNFVAAEETVTIEEDTNTFTQMVQENARIAAEQAEQEYDPGTVTVSGDINATETVTAEFVSSVNRYWIFFDSKDVYVVDGDTIHGYITGYAWPNGEQVPEYIGDQKMLNNSEKVAIRYLGVDTFESAGNQYRNAKAAKLYGNVPWEALNTAGAEAKEYNHTMISAGKIIAVSIQYNVVTKEQIYDDASRRIMGVVYSTNYANWEEASAAVKGNYFKGINVNKELLKPMYSDYEAILEAYPQSIAIPLAEYTSLRFSKATDGIKIATWMEELSLRNPPTEIVLEESYGATEEEIAGATDANANLTAYSSRKKLKSETRQDTSPMGYINNDLSFVKPYDDRAVEQRAYLADVVGDNELPWDYANRVRIGDVFIPIPPLSIRLDKQYSTEKVSVMRAKSSLQKNVGNVRNILTMDLYYHDLESINGTEMTGYLEQIGSIPVTYAMDGLRPLLAQFKKAPFLPIDNQYVNETLKINNVALRNIHVQTVPGFPSALKVTLMVEEFDASPYLMGEVSLGKKINYPLLRWHYQHLLREPFKPEPWRTYLPKVEHLDNQITFSILDEQELNTRQEIVRQFRSTKTPTEYKEELLDGEDNYGDGESEEEKEYNDGLRIRAALEQMDTFVKYVKNVKTADILGREYDKYAKIPVVIGEGLGYDAANNIYYFEVGSPYYNMMFSQETALGQKIAKAVYGKADDVKSKNAGLFTGAGLIASGFTSPAASAFFPMRAITSGVGYTGPIFRKHSPDRYKDVIENNFPGFFQLYLSSAKAKERLSTLEIKNMTLEGEDSILFLVPAGNMNDSEAASTSETDYLQILKELSDFATAYDKDVARYTSEYNALAREINRTEADMKMNECYIPNLIPLDLQISLENTFSTVQVQTAETPTMQYFGAQDPEIQLSFETDEAGVAAVEQMLRTVGRFVKQYRDGLVTGFMSIDAPLLNMMGVRSVIPVSAQYNTIAGHPDRFAVDLVLSAFDKTQRRQEALYGYTAGNPDDKLIDRAFDNYDPAVDSLYVHEHLRQMELYPDLEMPKVSELDDVITLINSQMEKWENRTSQVFLDPDFYISTNQTYRNYLKDALDDSKGVITRWQDASGLMANSDLLKNKALDMEGFTTATGESMESRFNAEAEKLEQIDPETTWSDFGEKTNTGDSEDTTATMTTGVATPPKFVFGTMNDYMKNKEYEKTPDYALWKTWGNTGTEEKFNEWKKENITEEVSEAMIWNYLADCIITYFGRAEELTYAKHEYEFLTDSKYTFTDNVSSYYYSDKTLGELSWVNGKNYYMTGYFLLGKANGNKRKLENGFAPEKDTGGNWYTTASAKGFKTMPFQRIMSYMRSIMRAESNWQQFEKGLPLFQETNADGYAVKAGIMGALLPSVKTTSDIGRLVWDWKFNMRTAIAAMAKVYHQCRDSEYNEISLRALDWAIISHSGAVLPTILTSDNEKDDKPGSFLDGDMVPERSSYYQSIETAKNTENILATNERATGIFLGRSGVIDDVYKMYNTGTVKTSTAGHGPAVQTEVKATDKEIEKQLVEERTSITLNMERWTTEEKFKGMFVDMYQHDQTGRMLRAFPSFSMQIVDEGKWFNNYRTWDNFYGFSALHSIDVYKSRKIAADTAVIKMSNMYSGLTTKRKDMEYSDLNVNAFWSAQFWEQDVFNIPDEEVLTDRKEMFKTMMLQTGARIHLRMGYGSDARYLPIVFNGAITEVGTGDELEIVCQGDGLELSNVISGSENDKNSDWFTIYEPSEYIGRLLTSRGNWMKDFISYKSDGEFFKDNPLGIAHFGSSIKAPSGTLHPFGGEFGEAAQNIYSQNGQFMKEQWRNKKNKSVEAIHGMLGGLTDGDIFNLDNLTPPEDEDNILVSLYGSTPWDIIQTFTMCSKDYVASVVPFDSRSTLFFGKPHWPMTYKYDSEYAFDVGTDKWTREIIEEHKKTFMQAHIYTSGNNIICNDIKASEEGVYTNVIVSYDGHMVGPMQADNDIRLEKQKTTMVEANIMGHFGTDGSWADIFSPNYYTAEAQAQVYGMSAVRDNMKDMYKGSYTVLGDPTVKPYDVCFMTDNVQDMEGIHLVKAVHHSMSLETGFITVIEPDAYVINWDAELLFLPDKVHNVGKNVVVRAGMFAAGVAIAGGTSHVMSILFSEAESIIAKFGPKIGETLLHNGTGIFYETLGHLTGDSEIVELAKMIRKEGLPREEVFKIHDILKDRKVNLQENKKFYSALKEHKAGKDLSLNYADIMDEVVLKSADNVDDAMDAYKTAVKVGNVAKTGQAIGTGLKVVTPIVKKVGSMAATVLKSSLFWTLAIDLVIEIATSGLLEMWTRSKQNAECVKIIPLTYKGQAYTAGITGHRGSVWGDTPSLSDRIRNAEWGSGDDEVNDTIWGWLPGFLNSVNTDDKEMNTSDLYQDAYEETTE